MIHDLKSLEELKALLGYIYNRQRLQAYRELPQYLVPKLEEKKKQLWRGEMTRLLADRMVDLEEMRDNFTVPPSEGDVAGMHRLDRYSLRWEVEMMVVTRGQWDALTHLVSTLSDLAELDALGRGVSDDT